MFRVETQFRAPGKSRPIVERGPWHPNRETAEVWAERLGNVGYAVSIEGEHGKSFTSETDDHQALSDALSSMA